MLKPFRDHMATILSGQKARNWAAPGEMNAETLSAVREPLPPREMCARPLQRLVQELAIDLAGCVVPVSP